MLMLQTSKPHVQASQKMTSQDSLLRESTLQESLLRDFHAHSTFCDGGATLEEMVRAAVAKGMDSLGFSEHGHTYFDDSYCLSVQATEEYRQQVAQLKEEWRGSIRILCGTERDFFSDDPFGGFDYTIGSVHYVQTESGIFPVDESPEDLKWLVNSHFGGDFYALAEEYFRCVAQVVETTRADVIGHFDLIAKYNQQEQLFDESNERYWKAATKAIDALIPLGKPFEINTGAFFKGYRDQPYPSMPLLRYIAENGGRVILSSDSHCTESLCYGFEQWGGLARELGLEFCTF